LLASTPEWCAPEVLGDHHLDLYGMTATDVYSYGLALFSAMLGRSYYRSLTDYETYKRDDGMFEKAIAVIEQKTEKV
jgi:serine/threonine protein kinase